MSRFFPKRIAMVAATVCAFVPIGFRPQPAPAQEVAVAADEPGFDPRAFRDSLSRITERRTLRQIEAANAHGRTASSRVAAGFAALRYYELTHLRDDAKKARRHFENARDMDSENPWPLVGWAMATIPLIRPEDDPGRFGFAGDNKFMEDLGLDARSRARRAVEKAVALDPGMPEAAALLAKLAVETHDKKATSKAFDALQKLADANPDDALSRLALATAALESGDLETAAFAAKAAASLATATSATASAAHHLAARALLRMPGREAEGTEEYFAGLRNLSREEADKYYAELRGVATRSELAELERLPLVRAQSWIQTFWDMHAALSAVPVSHRLASHFERLAEAQRLFVRRQRFGAPTTNALMLERPESPFDDRGYVYIRHGPPDDIITTRSTQSWVYMKEGPEPMMYHFTDGRAEGIEGFGDWYLMYNLPCDPDFLAARAGYDQRLSSLIYRCDVLKNRDISARVRRDVYEGLRTDVDGFGFTAPVTAAYDIYTFRSENRWTDVVGAVAIDATGLRQQNQATGDRLYSVKTSLIVIDTATRAVSRKDTLIEARATDFATRGSMVLGTVQLTAIPNDADVHRLSVSDGFLPAHGQLYGGPLNVTSYAGDTLMMSDIVLAAPDSVGTFHRGGVTLALVPWQAFPQGAFRIFYELYNVSPGNEYSTEMKVESVGKGITGAISELLGRKPAVALQFDDVAPVGGPTTTSQLRDASADLPPGDYRLTVVVTDKRTGQKVSRSRTFKVTK